jgi:hypothetical protein
MAGKLLIFGADTIQTYGAWENHKGLKVSNDWWSYSHCYYYSSRDDDDASTSRGSILSRHWSSAMTTANSSEFVETGDGDDSTGRGEIMSFDEYVRRRRVREGREAAAWETYENRYSKADCFLCWFEGTSEAPLPPDFDNRCEKHRPSQGHPHKQRDYVVS